MDNTFILKFPLPIAQSFSLKLKFNLKLFWTLSFILIIFCLGFYLFQVNEIAKSSYLIGEYEKEKTHLSQEAGLLQANLSQVGSLENIDKLVDNLGFAPVTKIHYIKILEKTIVKNNN